MGAQDVSGRVLRRGGGVGVVVGVAGVLVGASLASGQGLPPLASFFGFGETRVVVVDDNAGPLVVADFDGDGLRDLAIANDAKSRIEVHLQRERARTADERERELRTNELPPSPWYDRAEVPVAHSIGAMVARDLNGDGRMDLLYAGRPSEVVALHQTAGRGGEEMSFEIAGRRRIRDLGAARSSFAVADVRGDSGPELVTLVDGKVTVYALDETGPVGEPVTLPADEDIVAFFLEDFDGSGTTDVMGVLIESEAPLRLWRQRDLSGGTGVKEGLLGAEVRFEMPPLIEVEPFRTPGRAAASVAVIERQSRRMVLYDLVTGEIDPRRETALGVAEREAVIETYAFRGGEDRSRAVAIADLDADGRLDVVSADREANSLSLRLQRPGIGLASAVLFSAFKEPSDLAAGEWDGDRALEVFVLSEEENAVGVADLDAARGRLGFPSPIAAVTGGATPVAMAVFDPLTPMAGVASSGRRMAGSVLAVVMRDRRDHVLEVHFPPAWDEASRAIELEDVNRPPESMLGGDFDRDGWVDVLLFTPGEPMVMVSDVLGGAGDPVVLTDDDMTNFGLVNAAGPTNVSMLDVDSDGRSELLIADENFVRAASFDRERGWSVVEQITVPDPGSTLSAVATFEGPRGPVIAVADTANDLVLVIERDGSGEWAVADKLRLTGVEVGALRAGVFDGSGEPSLLALTPDAFALVRLAGTRVSLEEFASYRSDDEGRREHEIEAGDVNNDGFTDLVVVEDTENLMQIFTLSSSRRLLDAMSFKVFEARLFQGGGRSGREPSDLWIDDVTGDGLVDLIVEVHDRYLVYPQSSE